MTSRRAFTVLLAISAAPLAVGATYLPKWRGSPEGVTSRDLQALREDLEALKALGERGPAVVRTYATLPTGSVAATAAPLPPQASQTAEAIDADEERYRQVVVQEAKAQAARDTYELESADESWASDAQQRIEAMFPPELANTLSASAECRRTLCRILFKYQNTPEGMDAARGVADKHPWPGRSLTYVDFEKLEGYAYLAREGFELPGVDPASLTY